MKTAKHRSKKTGQQRSAARLAAVQALYNAELTGHSADTVLQDILGDGLGAKALTALADDAEAEDELVAPDTEMFAAILRGTLTQQSELDAMMAGALTGDWTVGRLEVVLRAILRAGAFELSSRADIPTRVVISEYVDVAHAFYAGPEPGLVNAVLDRIARLVRSGEFGSDAEPR